MNTSSDLSITVFGKAGAGKSLVAMIIKKALDDAGLSAVVHNEDVDPKIIEGTFTERALAIGERLGDKAIEIRQVQLRRGEPS